MEATFLRKEICCMNLKYIYSIKTQKLVHIQCISTYINYFCFELENRYFSRKVEPILMQGKYTERIIFFTDTFVVKESPLNFNITSDFP